MQIEALGQSEPFLNLQERLSKVAPVNRPVLLLGERGTGKELAASRLHYLSSRWDGPFVTLNCATLSPNLIEAELFGYEKGAFTGASERKHGRFEEADGGTLFLDEIGSIPLQAQEKILRAVEYKSFERVGSNRPTEVDVRIIGATNANLSQMAKDGTFKEDLLDRLSFEVLFLPPLRYRGEDILLLASHFAAKMSYELDHDYPPTFSSKAKNDLINYNWPGNVRELKNVVERAVYQAESESIREIVFDPFSCPFLELQDKAQAQEVSEVITQPTPQKTDLPPINSSLPETLQKLEIDLINEALSNSRFNQKKAATNLGISYDQLRGKIKKYGNKISA